MPFVRRTRATLRSAEFGFFGVVVYTRVHTPRRCGAATFFLRPLPDFRPGVASFLVFGWRPLRTSWEVVGMRAGHGSSGPRSFRGVARALTGNTQGYDGAPRTGGDRRADRGADARAGPLARRVLPGDD